MTKKRLRFGVVLWGNLQLCLNMYGMLDRYNSIIVKPSYGHCGQGVKCVTVNYHPSSGIKMLGYEISKFEGLKQFVREVAKLCPLTRIVGWDMALTDKGFVLIEGNMGLDEDAMQLDGVGYYKFIKDNW